MSSGGIQITIPDFDDEEFSSTPIPFGRPGGHAFGMFGQNAGGLSSAPESPTSITPIALPERADRSYFHSRGDSFASDDSSTHSQQSHSRFGSTPSRPIAFPNSSQISVATTNSTGPFSRKPSFASIRNAFKSGKSSEAPPVPMIDHQAYPVLKNPFNRSTSSLAHLPSGGQRKPSVVSTPQQVRTPTPKSRNNSYARSQSQHSHNGSIFHTSDTGSDHGHGFGLPYSSSPPPVPPVPNAFGAQFQRSESPLSLEADDKIVMDPRTPSDYALHAVFMRFATSAEMKIDAFLREGLEHDALLPDFMGPDVDPKFDELLQSLGKIAQKHTKPVVESVMRWRKSQNEPVSPEILRAHTAVSPAPSMNRGPSARSQDPLSVLSERKSLASIYIMCRVLIAVLQSISKDALGEALGYSLEETTFEQFRKPDLKLLALSANHRINAELYATLLGHIANVRFVSVTDRFLGELSPVASGQVPKDLDMKYENLVKGLKHIQIKVWPPEAFEEAAEFMESLSKSFANAHGQRLKMAFAETLVHLLHPIGKTAQAEVNHPQWAKAIEIIFPKAKDMMTKPRYWSVAYPLLITSLCVAPQQLFLRHWVACFDMGLTKLKEKAHRVPVMNGMMRLLWTYLYRCQEPASTSVAKVDGMLRRFFPPGRLSIFPSEESLEPFICIVHFVLSRHFEQGRDFCLELMQEQAIKSSSLTNIAGVLAPERTAIAVQAMLLSLHGIERDEPSPTWPSSTDFTVISSEDDYPSSSEILPASILAKPGMEDFFDRSGSILATVAGACSVMVGQMSIFDEQWSIARLNPTYEDAHSLVVRRHPEGTVAYPNHLAGQISMLQTCFHSWPRCLHPSLPLDETVDMLIRGLIHVEPALGDAAAAAIKRFMPDRTHASAVLSRYAAFLFGATTVAHEGSGIRLSLESARLLNVWITLVDEWTSDLAGITNPELSAEDKVDIAARCDEIEAGALFLLSHEHMPNHAEGVKVIRMLGRLSSILSPDPSSPVGTPTTVHHRVVDLLHGKGLTSAYLHGFDELLDSAELDRLEQWRKSTRPDTPLRLADSTNDKDRRLWRFAYPAFLQSCLEHPSPVSNHLRETLVAAASRYHPLMAHFAGLSSRVPAGLSPRNVSIAEKDGYRLVKENKHLVDQWHVWVKILCATASLSDSRPALTSVGGRDHARAPSDTSFERERMTTTRGLFRYLTPFLDSEYTTFRDAAVLCISSLPSSGYPQLLEDLSLLAARQFYDESRIKPGAIPPATRTRRQERLHSAVARIYYLTADFLPHQRSAGRQAALTHVLKFVRNTQTFLTSPDMRDNYSLQRLRRYFCGTVERLFDGLASLKDSDRFIPSHMHLSLYRLCEEWCEYGSQPEQVKQRLILMQRASASSGNTQEPDSVQRFQHETKLLSNAAVGALAALCQKAFFPPDVSAGSPLERSGERPKLLEPHHTLERLSAIISSAHYPIQIRGQRALRSLLAYPTKHIALLEEALRRAFVTSKDVDAKHGRFFSVVSDVVCNVADHGFKFSQILCLGLSNLCHPRLENRRCAFNMLETIHIQSSGILPMSQFEHAIGSSAPNAYLRAHRLVSDFLAGEHASQAIDVLSQLASWLPRLRDGGDTKIPLLLLQSLESWVPNIDLMMEDKSRLSPEGLNALYHLVSLSLRYGNSHPEQILVLWTRLVEHPHQSNGHATIRFLLEQSHKVGSTIYIDCAANIVACLSQTAIGRQIVEDLCGVIEPARMLPNIEHKLQRPNTVDVDLWSDLDALFHDQPRLQLGAAQFALFFLTDITLDRQWDLKDQIPVLLHGVFVHLDHRVPYIRQQARRMLFQLMRAWSPGFDELPDRSAYLSRSALKTTLASLEKDAETIFWREEDATQQFGPKMQSLCGQVLDFMGPLRAGLAERWGTLALEWSTFCSIRPIAFRSLHLFRAIMPRATQSDLGLLLGRLSNSIAGTDENVHVFTSEIILTLSAVATAENLDVDLLPPMFWVACGCLLTTVEHEFEKALVFLESILTRVDLDDPQTVSLLLSHQPPEWMGSTSLQSSLLAGLRSSTTSDATFKILQTLSKISDSRVIDPSEGRVRDLYTLSLPWCLHAMATDSRDESLNEFATNIGRLANEEERYSIGRIMESFVKGRFRTKDDFLRQSVGSLREHYGADYWTEVVTLLMGLVFNRQRWLQVHSMQILKVLFQQRETRSPVDLLGSELLMPLLRLLETDLASQALEVLEEPMTISGGPAAKHVLRMSMRPKSHVRRADSVTDIFGMPEESGWCVAHADSLRDICRSNLLAVFDTCQMPTRPTRFEFEPDVEALSIPMEEDLGGLVQNLHELTSFFQDDSSRSADGHLPSHQLEARVAAILAKSTEGVTDVPPTPMFDVFRVGGMDTSSDSDEDSDNDSDDDAFIYDSPSVYRSALNGAVFH
ncbi:hypothetical protein PLICRDRAFT_135155 [Plicaturopsis crispa FD-325 SS-3]|nr:hypothetical protein PLICRDRAFT_135155 [Plicaturopsis crispa FD-325 SS-3]